MGCWNGTCGISQIHIRAGEEVVVFPISQVMFSDLCYTTSFWTPFTVPFYGKYDDYGNADETHGIGLKLMLSELKRAVITADDEDVDELFEEEEDDEGSYFGGEQMFWERAHAGNLMVRGHAHHPKVRVDKVFIKKSILDHLAANYVFESYDYDKTTYRQTFYSYTFKDVLAGIPGVIDRLVEVAAEEPEGLDAIPEDLREKFRHVMKKCNTLESTCRAMIKEDEMLQSDPHYNRAASWFSYEPMHLRYGSFDCSVNAVVGGLVEAGDRDTLTELLTAYMTTLFVDQVLMDTRKLWSPQSGAGSQADADCGYRAIAAATIHVLDEEAKERAED